MKIHSSIKEVGDALGLNEYEVQLYAAALELGMASAGRLAQRTGIPRTSVYSALERLKKKGLVALEHHSGSQMYLPAAPEALVTRAEEALRQAQTAVVQAKTLSRLMESARGQDAMTSSKILLFEGHAAIKNMLYEWDGRWRNSLIESRTAWSGFQDESFIKHYGDWIEDYWRRYKDAKDGHLDTVRLFADEGTYAREVKQKVAATAGSRRQLKPLGTKFSFSASFWVIGEYLVLLKTNSTPHYALQLRDKTLTENMRAVFEILWRMSPE